MSNTKALMQPIVINGIEIRNRVLMPAMDTNYGDSEGYVSLKQAKTSCHQMKA